MANLTHGTQSSASITDQLQRIQPTKVVLQEQSSINLSDATVLIRAKKTGLPSVADELASGFILGYN